LIARLAMAVLLAAMAVRPCAAAEPATLGGYLRDGWEVRFWLEHENAFIIQKGSTIMRCNFLAVDGQPTWQCHNLTPDKMIIR
jgi:hypothetical protein